MKGGENFNEIIDRKRGETEYEYQLKLNGPLYKKNELIKMGFKPEYIKKRDHNFNLKDVKLVNENSETTIKDFKDTMKLIPKQDKEKCGVIVGYNLNNQSIIDKLIILKYHTPAQIDKLISSLKSNFKKPITQAGPFGCMKAKSINLYNRLKNNFYFYCYHTLTAALSTGNMIEIINIGDLDGYAHFKGEQVTPQEKYIYRNNNFKSFYGYGDVLKKNENGKYTIVHEFPRKNVFFTNNKSNSNPENHPIFPNNHVNPNNIEVGDNGQLFLEDILDKEIFKKLEEYLKSVNNQQMSNKQMSNQQIMVQSQDIIEQMQYSNKINREKNME